MAIVYRNRMNKEFKKIGMYIRTKIYQEDVEETLYKNFSLKRLPTLKHKLKLESLLMHRRVSILETEPKY